MDSQHGLNVELEFDLLPTSYCEEVNYEKLTGRIDRVSGKRWEERSILILDKGASVKAQIRPGTQI